MALVNVVNMVVLDNPCNFANPFQFEITFECLQELEDDLEWKVLYVGSAHDAGKDQVLDEILVGPVPVGINKFVLQADAPLPEQLPPDEILGVTVVLVTCCYKEREFVRVGYYVNNELQEDPEVVAARAAAAAAAATSGDDAKKSGENGDPQPQSAQAPPPPPPVYPQLDMNKVQRQILADKPRVTKFPIQWDDNALVGTQQSSSNQQQQGLPQNETTTPMTSANNENRPQQQQSTNALISDPAEAKMAAAMDTSLRGSMTAAAAAGGGGDAPMAVE